MPTDLLTIIRMARRRKVGFIIHTKILLLLRNVQKPFLPFVGLKLFYIYIHIRYIGPEMYAEANIGSIAQLYFYSLNDKR